MRLFELTGYKGHEAYAKLKNPNDKNLYRFTTYMEDQGFILLGEGGFATVFEHPNLDYCVKIFKKDAGYRAFLKLCSAYPANPHFPRFRGKIIDIDGETAAVRMEKLNELAPKERYIIDIIDKMFNKVKAKPMEAYNNDPDLQERLKDQPDFFQTAMYLYTNRPYGVHMDFHSGNTMKRGSTFVITDPFVG